MEGADLILVVASAWAATVDLGVALGVGSDLPDILGETSGAPSFAPVGDLRAGLDVGFGAAALRATLATTVGPAHDTVYWWDGTWNRSDDHWALYAGAAALVGPSVRVPSAPGFQAVLAMQAGVLGAGFFHSFGGDTQVLLDPDQNALDDPGNIDPYTLQAVPAVDASVGMRLSRRGAGRGVAATVDVGYTAAWVPAADLRRSPPESGARRAAVAVDALRIAVGAVFPLSRPAFPTAPTQAAP